MKDNSTVWNDTKIQYIQGLETYYGIYQCLQVPVAGTFASGTGISRYILHKAHTVLRKILKIVHTNEVTSGQLGQKKKYK